MTTISQKRIHGSSSPPKYAGFLLYFFFLEVVENPWILFLTTMSLKRIHGSSTTSKTFRGVEYVRIFQLVINEEDEKIVNL